MLRSQMDVLQCEMYYQILTIYSFENVDLLIENVVILLMTSSYWVQYVFHCKAGPTRCNNPFKD